MSDQERHAPVQGERHGTTIPWDVHLRAWQVYAACGNGDQSAERIAERGGFGYGELIKLLAERNPYGGDGWNPLTELQQRHLTRLRGAALTARIGELEAERDRYHENWLSILNSRGS
jgi:hypothetical protein